MSKLNINSISCFKEIAELLMLNKNMKTLNMVRVNMTDDHAILLAEPLTRSMNLENLKLDNNNLTGVFMEKYCSSLSKIGFTPVIQPSGIAGVIERNASASILASESEDATISGALSKRSITNGI